MIEIVVVDPEKQESRHRFDQSEILIGRKPGNDLVFRQAGVSSKHARIFLDSGEVWIEDLKSLNGTIVNGRPLKQPRPITTDDIVIISDFRLSIWQLLENTSAGRPEIELQIAQELTIAPEVTPVAQLNPVGATQRPRPADSGSSHDDALSPGTLPDTPFPHFDNARPTELHREFELDLGEEIRPVSEAAASGWNLINEVSLPHPIVPASPKAGATKLDPNRAPAAKKETPTTASEPRAKRTPAASSDDGGARASTGKANNRESGWRPIEPASPPPVRLPTGTPRTAFDQLIGEESIPVAPVPRELAVPAVPDPPATPGLLPAYRPAVPNSIDETGLKRSHVTDLILKTIYYAGEISGIDLADQLKLNYHVILDPIIQELRRDKLLEIKGGGGNFGPVSMIYTLTNKAAEPVRQILDRNRYVGPAPVTMQDYIRTVEAQAIRNCRIPKRRIVREFDHLIVDDYVYDGIGPALNSATAILFYGPPGNGKTAICQAMVNCLDDHIFIPYAIEVDGNFIQVFDEHNHKVVPRPDTTDVEFDPRYVLCKRPLIMVGGELELDMLDMSYSTDAKYYEAPFQTKANGGILLVDDFGRQKVAPKELLNRWIVPLESSIDFISLVTGRKLKIPFDVFVVFATNLNPEDLVDDAFLRRVRYKIEVKRPEPHQFKNIFRMACKTKHIPWDDRGFDFLMSLYSRDNRAINACEPRNILAAIASLSDYFECDPRLTENLIERAYNSYFTRFNITAN